MKPHPLRDRLALIQAARDEARQQAPSDPEAKPARTTEQVAEHRERLAAARAELHPETSDA